jgi:preprotein translocase subunit SecG
MAQPRLRQTTERFVDSSPLPSTLRELRRHLTDPQAIGIMAVIGVLLGLAGPFGSFATLEVLPRVVYWLATVFLTYGFGFGISMLADALWGRGRPVWQRLVIMIVPAGLGATAIVAPLNLVTFGAAGFDWREVPILIGQCFAVAAGVVIVVLLTERRQAGVAVVSDGPPAILERVPLPRRGALLALVVEDHYVDIITDKGKTLVLMRLADAIRETSGVAGSQVHRSHWVAHAAVVRSHRADGKVLLELSNGMRLPVSRGYLPAARQAGLA